MNTDLIIIGGGPGGYVAAELAGASGLSVLLVERSEIGGVCLNEGCIPTKSLLNSAKLYAHAKESAKYGFTCDNPKFDLSKAMAWKNEVVTKLRKNVEGMMKKGKVAVEKGNAKLIASGKVEVNGTVHEARNIIIATGSSTFIPPIPGADGKQVLTSSDVLKLEKLPSSVGVIGGGVIGIEFASFFSSLGIRTSVIEMMPEIVPFMDSELAPVMRRAMPGIEFHLSAKVEKIDGHKIRFTKEGKQQACETDLVLMAVGRRPNLKDNGFESAGLEFDSKGVKVDEATRTNLPGVYAIGDVTGKWMLAHVASRMAEVAVNNILRKPDRMRSSAIPWAVYSLPEAAGAGRTEQELKANGTPYKKTTIPMRANGRFLAENGDTPAACKMLCHAETGVLLGVHMTGAYCTEIIHSAATMIESELRVHEIAEIIFPHPSVSEVIRDTAIALSHQI